MVTTTTIDTTFLGSRAANADGTNAHGGRAHVAQLRRVDVLRERLAQGERLAQAAIAIVCVHADTMS